MSDVSSMGTVKSVQVAATGPIQSSQNTSQTETLSTTISLADAYGDTKNPYSSKTKNFVLAAPSSENGTPSFRALTTADIPNITVSKISDFPTIPDKTSDLTNDSDFISNSDLAAGSNITITENSEGQTVISSSGGGGASVTDHTLYFSGESGSAPNGDTTRY